MYIISVNSLKRTWAFLLQNIFLFVIKRILDAGFPYKRAFASFEIGFPDCDTTSSAKGNPLKLLHLSAKYLSEIFTKNLDILPIMW